MTVAFEIRKDPRTSATQEDMQAKFDFLISIREKLSETHNAIRQIRELRKQVEAILKRLEKEGNPGRIKEAGEALVKKATAIEEALYQTKNRSRQDPLNFPIRLNNRLSALAGLVGFGNDKPTDQAVAVRHELVSQIDVELAKLRTLLDDDLPAFNKLVHESATPAVILPASE